MLARAASATIARNQRRSIGYNVLAVTALDLMTARQLSMQPKTIANAGMVATTTRFSSAKVSP